MRVANRLTADAPSPASDSALNKFGPERIHSPTVSSSPGPAQLHGPNSNSRPSGSLFPMSTGRALRTISGGAPPRRPRREPTMRTSFGLILSFLLCGCALQGVVQRQSVGTQHGRRPSRCYNPNCPANWAHNHERICHSHTIIDPGRVCLSPMPQTRVRGMRFPIPSPK
jgi:hypothetical protein